LDREDREKKARRSRFVTMTLGLARSSETRGARGHVIVRHCFTYTFPERSSCAGRDF